MGTPRWMYDTSSLPTSSSSGAMTRTATVAVAVVWAAAYLAVVRRHDELDALAGDRASATYFAVALVLAAVLVLRHPAYFLLVYTLYPQAFLFLNRWRWMGVGLVTAVLALVWSLGPPTPRARPPAPWPAGRWPW